MHKVIKIVLLSLSVFSFQIQPYYSYHRRHNSEQAQRRREIVLKKQVDAEWEKCSHNNTRITDHRIVGIGWKTILVSGLIAILAFVGGFLSLLLPIGASLKNMLI